MAKSIGWLAKEKSGHETHFQNVAQSFFDYLVTQNLPEWEISSTLAKYYIITSALEAAKENKEYLIDK